MHIHYSYIIFLLVNITSKIYLVVCILEALGNDYFYSALVTSRNYFSPKLFGHIIIKIISMSPNASGIKIHFHILGVGYLFMCTYSIVVHHIELTLGCQRQKKYSIYDSYFPFHMRSLKIYIIHSLFGPHIQQNQQQRLRRGPAVVYFCKMACRSKFALSGGLPGLGHFLLNLQTFDLVLPASASAKVETG